MDRTTYVKLPWHCHPVVHSGYDVPDDPGIYSVHSNPWLLWSSNCYIILPPFSLEQSHTGRNLAEKTAGCVRRFGLEKKVSFMHLFIMCILIFYSFILSAWIMQVTVTQWLPIYLHLSLHSTGLHPIPVASHTRSIWLRRYAYGSWTFTHHHSCCVL